MIQEPQNSLCFSQNSNDHEMPTFNNNAGFEPENANATN
ncbi:hypothetical protein D026_4796 [Vibrio parahaemolyticus 605]|nr:conserved hypothetical protein [Vibrio parahaemolyticus AN-5034]EQL94781.1 hypothetical protein D035_1176 [Vibrio parahaemolyticus VP250]EQL96796.1 hypothetical protein D036_3264 [Vibrio parahaemolyticus VP232]EQL97436.1 hypothetical protein D040_1920 [Vibrio parahaemolyticus NIHCB0603]EQM06114.1 hypothetical protein D045_1240 [Vibrio parahaemolyticus VP-NY4]ETS19606.1 hypothetical protein D033_4859 [Vibrio parahaemolyticus B-265]ETT06516.1 hypothetical protein D026_4796 [Vibrio parahaemol